MMKKTACVLYIVLFVAKLSSLKLQPLEHKQLVVFNDGSGCMHAVYLFLCSKTVQLKVVKFGAQTTCILYDEGVCMRAMHFI
jgi:hypothetical protein